MSLSGVLCSLFSHDQTQDLLSHYVLIFMRFWVDIKIFKNNILLIPWEFLKIYMITLLTTSVMSSQIQPLLPTIFHFLGEDTILQKTLCLGLWQYFCPLFSAYFFSKPQVQRFCCVWVIWGEYPMIICSCVLACYALGKGLCFQKKLLMWAVRATLTYG